MEQQQPRYIRETLAALHADLAPAFGALPLRVQWDAAPWWSSSQQGQIVLTWPRYRRTGPREYTRDGQWGYWLAVQRSFLRSRAGRRAVVERLSVLAWQWLQRAPARRRGWNWQMEAPAR